MIRAEGLNCKMGDFELRAIDLTVAEAEHFVILGPPGSGKTVLLECLCGLNRIEGGRVTINGRDVTALEPRRREIGYVPQDYAILPHLSVKENIGFGLGVRGMDRPTAARKIDEMALLLKIGHLLERSPAGLSGGEKQRVALARALILSPRVLILDEPVSALDDATRQEVCFEISRIQKQLGVTTLHVSHNLEEALSMADRAGVLMEGRFAQIGTLDDLLNRPRNTDLARFMRCGNIFEGQAEENAHEGGAPRKEDGLSTVSVGAVKMTVPGRHSGAVSVVVRPEKITVGKLPAGRGAGENEFPVRPGQASDFCNYVRVELVGPLDMVAHLSPDAFEELSRSADSPLVARLNPEQIHVIDGRAESPLHR